MKIRIQKHDGRDWADVFSWEVTERGQRSVCARDDEGYAQTYSLADGAVWYSVKKLRIHPDDLAGLRVLPMRLAKTKPADEIDLNRHALAPLLRKLVQRVERSHDLMVTDPTTALDLIQAEVLTRGDEEPEILETCAAVAVMGLAVHDERGKEEA